MRYKPTPFFFPSWQAVHRGALRRNTCAHSAPERCLAAHDLLNTRLTVCTCTIQFLLLTARGMAWSVWRGGQERPSNSCAARIRRVVQQQYSVAIGILYASCRDTVAAVTVLTPAFFTPQQHPPTGRSRQGCRQSRKRQKAIVRLQVGHSKRGRVKRERKREFVCGEEEEENPGAEYTTGQ